VVAVLADVGDALALLHAFGDQGVGDAVRQGVELAEGGGAALEGQGHIGAPLTGVIAGDVAQGRHLVEVDGGHVFPSSLLKPSPRGGGFGRGVRARLSGRACGAPAPSLAFHIRRCVHPIPDPSPSRGREN
jgi:hypothetical protein